jgi:hypothetical protein
MNSRMSKRIKIGFAIGMVALTALACDDGVDVQGEAYKVIQEGQNTIQDAGKDAQGWVDDAGLNEPTGIEQSTGGLTPWIEGIINSECD